MKNNPDQVEDLVDYFDYALSEECTAYDECGNFLPFINANKAATGALYKGEEDYPDACTYPNNHNMDFIYKNMKLDSWVEFCRTYDASDANTFTCNSSMLEFSLGETEPTGSGVDNDDESDFATPTSTNFWAAALVVVPLALL
eukprot:TRINITY_DN4323_c0_g1_i3.p1 TRINITY_DN4323_c0_g1~~TRINITY_DN4323_c0_g1_i3.p1  ORF type:complete len:143 (-),score=37.54 TRINITY_DN4323_c0_g1_i3:85-513(-)